MSKQIGGYYLTEEQFVEVCANAHKHFCGDFARLMGPGSPSLPLLHGMATALGFILQTCQINNIPVTLEKLHSGIIAGMEMAQAENAMADTKGGAA